MLAFRSSISRSAWGACPIPERVTRLLFDTSAVIGFLEEIDGAALLKSLVALGYELVLPSGVRTELLQPSTRAAVRRSGLFTLGAPESDEEVEKLKARYPSLGGGELAVIALGRRLEVTGEDYLCVLDDKAARNAAAEMNLRLTGSIGLLHILEQKGLLTAGEARNLTDQLKAGGFRYKGD